MFLLFDGQYTTGRRAAVSDDITTTKQMMDAYMQPAIEQAERIRAKSRRILTETFTGDRAFSDGLTLYASPLLYDYYSQNGIPSPFTYLVKNEPLPYLEAADWTNQDIYKQLTVSRIYRHRVRDARAKKRVRRQHRAASRRRKRGLA